MKKPAGVTPGRLFSYPVKGPGRTRQPRVIADPRRDRLSGWQALDARDPYCLSSENLRVRSRSPCRRKKHWLCAKQRSGHRRHGTVANGHHFRCDKFLARGSASASRSLCEYKSTATQIRSVQSEILATLIRASECCHKA